MIDRIENSIKEVNAFVIKSQSDAENFRLKYLSKKGLLNQYFLEFKDISSELKRDIGTRLNILKELANSKFDESFKRLQDSTISNEIIDYSIQGYSEHYGTRHPVSVIRNEIIEIFKYLGFTVSEGSEIEDDWHVFSALNFPEEHPARDMQDTFFIQKKPDILLRTHTSSVQVRVMESQEPPIRTISPGRVYRHEVITASSHCMFHQVEGLNIDENVSFADLKQTLLFFAREMFGRETKIRLRPSFFPFTEPSAEMDISCKLCGGKGCVLCKNTGWLEILGCGMVDPNVLDYNHIDSQKYTGFAFGMGIDRIALLKYQIKDIRLLFENDLRFLNQFINVI